MFKFIKSFFLKSNQEKQVNEEKNGGKKMEEAEKELKERIIKHEGLRLKPYRCTAGKLTIGVGRNIEDNGISKEEADFMLMNDIAQCYKELQQNFPWEKDLSPRRRGVLVEMIFNLGITRFKQFKNMLLACQMGDFEKAANEALNSAWHKQVGKRAEVLAQVLKEG